MPAHAHRRAPGHLAGANTPSATVPYLPPGAGASPTAILAEGACSIGPPLQSPGPPSPGKVPPAPPPSRCANWRIRKIAISFPPCRGIPPAASLPEGPLSIVPSTRPPGKLPPRASRLALGRPLRAPASPPLHFHLPSTPPTGAANSPAAPTGAPRPPSRAAKHPRPPLAPGLGEGGPPVAHGCVGTGVPGGRTARVTLPGPPP